MTCKLYRYFNMQKKLQKYLLFLNFEFAFKIGYIELLKTPVSKSLYSRFLFVALKTLGTFLKFLVVGSLFGGVQTYQPIIFIYTRVNFVYHHGDVHQLSSIVLSRKIPRKLKIIIFRCADLVYHRAAPVSGAPATRRGRSTNAAAAAESTARATANPRRRRTLTWRGPAAARCQLARSWWTHSPWSLQIRPLCSWASRARQKDF